MAWFHPILFVKLVAISVVLSRDHSTRYSAQGGSRTRIYMAAILPDAGRRFTRTHAWPFSIQNVLPAINLALRRVNNEKIAFDVK